MPKPSERFKLQEPRDPEHLALRTPFRRLYALTSHPHPHPHHPSPKPTPAAQRRLGRALGFEATMAANDGVVPTLSPRHGRVLHAARAHDLDMIGHSTLAGGETVDWRPSGAGLSTAAFEATRDTVAGAIARHRRVPRGA